MKPIVILSFIVFFWAGAPASAQDTESPRLQRAVFTVGNISCKGCFYAVNDRLSELEGFFGMGMNLFTRKVAVDLAAPLTPDSVRETLQDQGYAAVLESTTPVAKKASFAYLNALRSSGPGCCGTGIFANCPNTP